MEQYSTAYFQKLDLLSSLYAGQAALKDSLPTEGQADGALSTN